MTSTTEAPAAWLRAEMERTRRTQRRIWIAIGLFVVMAAGAVVVLVVDNVNHAERVAAGTRAVARVERLQEGFCFVGESHHTCMDIELAVSPADRAAFTTTVTHSVDHRWMSRVQPGQWLTVVLDKNEPSTVLIDDELFAVPPPSPTPR